MFEIFFFIFIYIKYKELLKYMNKKISIMGKRYGRLIYRSIKLSY